MFCMLLRKHIEGGVISSVSQHEMDRLIILKIKSKNEIGDDIAALTYHPPGWAHLLSDI